MHTSILAGQRFVFDDLRTLLARATPARSGSGDSLLAPPAHLLQD